MSIVTIIIKLFFLFLSQIRRTAYFDNRTFPISVIVIIILQNKRKKKVGPNLFAKVTMPDGTVWCQETEKMKSFPNFFFPRKDVRHGPDDYLCDLKKITLTQYVDLPNYIELSTNETCSDLLPRMPVFHEKREKRVKFALCLHKGIFGYVKPDLLIHFVEINKALGASIITIWIQNTTENVYPALLPYIKSGLVELLDWKVSVAMRNYGQFAVNNECLYRNIHRAEYLVLHDIDELLIPYKHDTWYELLEYVGKKINLSHYASIRFDSLPWRREADSSKIHIDMGCNMSLPYYFDMNYKAIKMDYSRPKLMVSVDRSKSLYTHFVPSFFEGVERQYRLQTTIGCCHHYRIPALHGSYKYDPIMKKFENSVMPSINKMLC